MPLFYIFTNNDNCTEVLMSVMFEPEQVLSKDFGFGLQGTNAFFFFFFFFFFFVFFFFFFFFFFHFFISRRKCLTLIEPLTEPH